ncbi:MAG: hypothetical protein HC802_13520, partial [Caldilineaceae bacterium]|nr:hypothetical protein [Caldilineaceae bacterium]
FSHVADVSIFNQRIGGGSPIQALLANVLRVAGMFNLHGDAGWTHNFSGRPVFDPLLSIPFALGVALWGVRLTRRSDPDRNALALLALWVIVMLSASVFSDDAPDFSRTLPTLPALMVRSAWA